MTAPGWTFTSTVEHADGTSIYVSVTSIGRPDVRDMSGVPRKAAVHASALIARIDELQRQDRQRDLKAAQPASGESRAAST